MKVTNRIVIAVNLLILAAGIGSFVAQPQLWDRVRTDISLSLLLCLLFLLGVLVDFVMRSRNSLPLPPIVDRGFTISLVLIDSLLLLILGAGE
jgi:hypothetical protein